MADEIMITRRKPNRGIIRELMSKHNPGDPTSPNEKRARFLALLKRRYGYTNDKAVDELERLLKQFYRTNKSLGIHHRPDSQDPLA